MTLTSVNFKNKLCIYFKSKSTDEIELKRVIWDVKLRHYYIGSNKYSIHILPF